VRHHALAIRGIKPHPSRRVAVERGLREDVGRADGIVVGNEPHAGTLAADHEQADAVVGYLKARRSEHAIVLLRQAMAEHPGRQEPTYYPFTGGLDGKLAGNGDVLRRIRTQLEPGGIRIPGRIPPSRELRGVGVLALDELFGVFLGERLPGALPSELLPDVQR